MNVAIGAIFQNATRYIDRFTAQYYSLVAYAPEHTFDPILIEGDSTDQGATWNKLNLAFPGHVHKREHGGQIFPSIDHAQRWRQVSYACDGVLELIRPEHDALLWVEADLIWEPSTAFKLLNNLSRVPAVCGMVFMRGMFYDTWAFMQAGVNFKGAPPYHPMLRVPSPNGLYPLDSGGSCWAVRGEVARKCRYQPPEQSIRGFWSQAKQHGYQLYLDPNLSVMHPPV